MPSEVNKSKEQKVAESAVESFRKDLGPFVVAGETTRMPMVFTDSRASDNPIIFANDSFLSLTGYDREEVLGHRCSFLMARGRRSKGTGASRGRVRGRYRPRFGDSLPAQGWQHVLGRHLH